MMSDKSFEEKVKNLLIDLHMSGYNGADCGESVKIAKTALLALFREEVEREKPKTATEVQHIINLEDHAKFVAWATEKIIMYGDVFSRWFSDRGVEDFFKYAKEKGIEFVDINQPKAKRNGK